MKKVFVPFILIVSIVLCFFVDKAEAVCAKVTIEILQSLTLERVAFDAKLVLTNSTLDTPLENIRLEVIINDKDGVRRDSLFFVRKPDLSGVDALDGTGLLGSGGRAEAHWLIIPAPGAGALITNEVATQIGVDYWVGATLSYTAGGKQEVVSIYPAKITVKPMPQLVLDYFMPYQVIGDNPFTPLVEAPVSYPLGLRVLNDGYGAASKLKIDSAQPKIVKNDLGLLIDFKLLGAAVNDCSVDSSLTVKLGDLGSKKVSTAYWEMLSTLTGKFTEFKASFTHVSELGGDLTSLINATNAHYLTHMIKVGLPGRDNLLDFLSHADTTDNDTEHLPDTIFESEIPVGSTNMADAKSPVNVVYSTNVPLRPTVAVPSVSLTLPTDKTGWIYTKISDPSQGLLKVTSVQRADGVLLDSHNFWVDEGVDKDFNRTWALQFVDYRGDVSIPGQYTVTYAQPAVDTTPPASNLIFDGPYTGTSPTYITPQTRLLLTAADNDGGSGVAAMYKKVSTVDSSFVAAFPFNLDQSGTYIVEYYGVDRSGNTETAKSSIVTVVNTLPAITAFTAIPGSFSPQAPKEVTVSRTVDFSLTANGGVDSMNVEIAIASGSSFNASLVKRTIKGSAAPGTPVHFSWDGKDSAGKLLLAGVYTARVKVSDGLDNVLDINAPVHTATADRNVTITEWFTALPVDPNPSADQLHARISGTRVVWQDIRNGAWNIYLKDLAGGAAAPSTKITTGAVSHEHPAIDGSTVVWQDMRSGGWEIYGYDLVGLNEITISTDAGDKEWPAVGGQWVVWQDKRNGNWDIYARNITTLETIQITSHERDQLHPAIFGSTVVWEDYRHGLGEIYSFDLVSRTEKRITFEAANQTQPAIFGSSVVWTDERNGQKDIYRYDPVRGSYRVTYGAGDHSQATMLNDLLVYSDFESGLDDPNLSYRVITNGTGGSLTTNPARQEEPAIGTNLVVWQDNRSGKYQIYFAPFSIQDVPVAVELKPGFNLIAVGADLAGQFASASAFIAAKGSEYGIDKVLKLDPLHNSYLLAYGSGGDFPLTKGMGLVIYANKSGSLTVAGSGESTSYNLVPGTNQIGILRVVNGYGAYDLMSSLGLDNVQSVRRFDAATGSWQTVAVQTTVSGNQLVGSNFSIIPGDGLHVVMKNRVDGWSP